MVIQMIIWDFTIIKGVCVCGLYIRIMAEIIYCNTIKCFVEEKSPGSKTTNHNNKKRHLLSYFITQKKYIIN